MSIGRRSDVMQIQVLLKKSSLPAFSLYLPGLPAVSGGSGFNNICIFRTQIIYKVVDGGPREGRCGRRSTNKLTGDSFDILFSDELLHCAMRSSADKQVTTGQISVALKVHCVWVLSHAESLRMYPEYDAAF